MTASGASCGLSPAADGLPAGPGQALRKSQCPEESLGITERNSVAGQRENLLLCGTALTFLSQKQLCLPPSVHQSEVLVSSGGSEALLRMLFRVSWLLGEE